MNDLSVEPSHRGGQTDDTWYTRGPDRPFRWAPRRTDTRAYLLDLNYYRLAYQSAAQSLNLLAEKVNAETVSRVPAHERSGEVSRLDAEASVRIARLLSDADAVGVYFDAQATTHRRKLWRRRRSLTQYEKGLRAFLASTIEPCARLLDAGLHLLRAGSLARPEFEMTIAQADAQIRKVSVTADELSYRVLYDLACVETQRAVLPDVAEERNRFDAAISHLRHSIDRAPDKQKAHLRSWAHDDPSLEALRRGAMHAFQQAVPAAGREGP